MAINVELHNGGQYDVAHDNHRFKVICAGRRWGKSVLSRMIVLKWATEAEGLYWVVSPTYKQAKMIHWREIQKEIPKEWIAKKNEVELSVTLNNGSIIELKGAENPDALRGVKLRGLVVDEIASIRNWDWLWHEVLRPTLTDYEAPAIFISTPKGFNHFYELFKIGQEENDLYKSWQFTTYDNPFIPKEEIDNAKQELSEDTFAQEYLADFRKYTGLVYKEFDRQIHVIEPFEIPSHWQIYRGFDFGSTNPTAVAWIAVDGDENWFIIDEYYKSGETIDYHAGIINANRYSNRVVQSFGDPSGAQWFDEFAQRGIYITPANKETGTSKQNWVQYKIEKVADKLRKKPGRLVPNVQLPAELQKYGLPALFVFKNCHHTISEFESYRWKEKPPTAAQDLNEPDMPEKANDHLMDAISYFACSYKPESNLADLPVDNRNWRIGK